MPMKGLTTCAVPGCNRRLVGFGNLCRVHVVSGAGVEIAGGSTMIITAWRVERRQEFGVILLNDYAYGDLFQASEESFAMQLRSEGFENVRRLETIEEWETERVTAAWIKPWGAPTDLRMTMSGAKQ